LEYTRCSSFDLKDWSGPNISYPLSFSSFVEEINISSLSSWVLVSAKAEILAFGQYYQRLNRCHLGRLVVNPQFRGQGVAAQLMAQLSQLGLAEFGATACSLFVLEHNASAIKAYEKYGFVVATYPEEIPLANCLYMVKS
jgi:ribosomal protein S18 acetylase RimI-like enzyme